jgi:1A family penicillin-binding protein
VVLKGKKTDEKTAQKKHLQALEFIFKAFYYIGKPFYLALSLIIISFLFIFYTTGHITRIFAGKILKIIKKITSLSKKSKKRAKKEEKKIKKIKISLHFNFIRLIFLKIKIFFIQTVKIKFPKIRLGIIKSLLLFSFIAFIISVGYVIYGIPSPKKLTERKIEASTKIYDRNGILLYTIYKDKNRTPVNLSQIPEFVKYATLAAEDAEFYHHPGFSIRGIIRAAIRNYTKGELSGGSTITQQLVKNALLTPEKTLIRKIREIILAILVEATYSKDKILEMYLNEVSYGGTAYGIEQASQTYFGKSVDKLTLAEAAFLAGLPKSPTKYSPFGETPQLGLARQKDVLNLMKINGFITEEQEKKALSEKLNFSLKRTDIKAPHFVMYVRKELEEKFSKEVVETGGLEVFTTLDYQIQSLSEKAVNLEIDKLANLNVRNGAALVINPKTGEILAMVGSKDYFDIKNDGNVNVTIAKRQPGSSIKIVNYTYALSHGFTAASILSDTPITYKIKGQPDYTPRNYDGNYRGNLTLRSAFAESRNIPAVRVLASYGVDKMIELGKKMGITTWEDKNRFGLSLTLGGGEVRLIDLAQVYATIANYGSKPQIRSITYVKNYEGKVLYQDNCLNQENSCPKEEVVDPRVAFLITDILKDNQARTPAFGSRSALVIDKHPEVAVKTGTSNELKDNLTLGYTQDYLVAVWVGNNNNSPMSRIASGITGAAPIFNRIMSVLLLDKESKPWDVPDGMVQLPICPLTGTLACNNCPVKMEWFLEENKPNKSCDPEFVKTLKKPQLPPEILEPAARIEAN